MINNIIKQFVWIITFLVIDLYFRHC